MLSQFQIIVHNTALTISPEPLGLTQVLEDVYNGTFAPSQTRTPSLAPGSQLEPGFPSPHADLYEELRARAMTYRVAREWNDPLFSSAALALGSPSDLLHLSAKIGVIDTGIEYTHPAVGGKFGSGNKVVGEYHFVGDAFTGLPGSPDPQSDNDLVTQAIPQGLTVSFPNNPSTVDVPEGGLMSSFSTYDPTNDMYFKPRVETFPRPLLLQVKGKTTATAKAARTLFENMAILVKQTATNTSLLETASHQGAGLVQVYDVIHATGTLIPAGILLNDTAKFKSVHTIFVKTRKRRR
ncbi:minor extracellular protease vpr protein [Ceratobasidium sp. AG-Ba]|nr:minor extracellular protease vpr protein [Ceratobasidium sp. AG-Ba]